MKDSTPTAIASCGWCDWEVDEDSLPDRDAEKLQTDTAFDQYMDHVAEEHPEVLES